jgi:hypothetical protein
VKSYKHLGTSGYHFREPIPPAVLGQDRVVGATPVIKNQVVSLPRTVPPRPQRPCRLVQPRHVDGAFHVHLVRRLLPHGDHGVLTSRYEFLAEAPVARHVPRVHSRVVGRLEAARLPVALLELPGAVSPGGHLAALEGGGG